MIGMLNAQVTRVEVFDRAGKSLRVKRLAQAAFSTDRKIRVRSIFRGLSTPVPSPFHKGASNLGGTDRGLNLRPGRSILL
jgi:hypothetical protein